MAWNGVLGSRTFTRLTGLFTGSSAWQQTESAGRGIEAQDHDTHDQDIATAIDTCLTKDGGNKPTANIDFDGFRITNLGTPSSSTDAATKTYVDAAVVATVNATVRVASTANVTKATGMDNGKSMDGVTLATNDRVLLKNQTSASENGVWVVAASGAPARATDFDTFNEHVGSIINVTAGSTNAGLSFRCTVNSGGTLDSTSITYVQFGTTLATPVTVANGGTGSSTAATAFAAIKQDASSSATGVVEIATVAEWRIGTDTGRVPAVNVPWDALAEVTLTDAATIAVDMSTFINAVVTLGGNRTLGNPTNPKAGQSGRIRTVQDGTGSRTLAFGSNWEFSSGQAPTLSTAAGDNDVLYYDVISATRILAYLVRDIS